MMRRLICWMLFFGVLTLPLSGCPKKQTVKKTTEEEPLQDEVESEELDIRDKEFVESKFLKMIHFDYDSSELTEEARKVLAANADYLKKNPRLNVLCEGHTDERGTVAYNLALGQRRAQSVRKYYISLGIAAKRLGSLSYGKEKPRCAESTEDCWTDNRRVETKVQVMKSVNGKGNEPEPAPEAP